MSNKKALFQHGSFLQFANSLRWHIHSFIRKKMIKSMREKEKIEKKSKKDCFSQNYPLDISEFLLYNSGVETLINFA